MALVRGSPGVEGSPSTPQARANFSRVGHLLVAAEDVGERPHVAPPLHVVLPPQGIHAGAGAPQIAGQHGQGGAAADVVDAVAVLGDPHGVDDHRPLRPGKEPRGGDDLPGVQAGEVGGPLRGPMGHG